MDTFRTLRIYGTRSPNTEYTVNINGEPVSVGTDELFSFVTNTKLHGSNNIVINVINGSITLTHCTATYPALFNGIEGTATMVQPIAEPVAVIENGEIKSIPFPIIVNADNPLNYEHLMFNGPTRFRISIEGLGIVPGINVFIGNAIKNEFTQGIVDIQVDYEYEKFPNEISSIEDLESLKLKVLMAR